MREVFDIIAAAILYGGLFGLAVLAVAVFCVGVAHVWRAMRFESANGSERDGAKALSPKSPAPTFFGKAVALLAAVLATMYGGSKSIVGRVTVDDPYIVDAGSFVTNDYVRVAIAKRYDIIPDDTEIMIYYRELAQTNAGDWVQYEKPSAPGYYVLSDFPTQIWMLYATNYNWLVAANYVQPPVVHTNGVWQIKGFIIPAGDNPPSQATYAFPNTKTIRKED